jgi:predicted TIM-barrel enzyme
MRYRSLLRAENVRIFADAHVKHGSHAIVADRSVPELSRDLAFFDADCIIATGQRTGHAASLDEIDEITGATHLPVLVGSGVSEDNIVAILARTSGVIVASSLKEDGVWWNPVEPARVKSFVARALAGL